MDQKEGIKHAAKAQANILVNSVESHGTETPGHISAAADTARETSLLMSLFWIILIKLSFTTSQIFHLLGIIGISWMLWKFGRSAWLGWFRLERLHRLLDQEKWEIEHQRPKEREELILLYSAKGFEGKLLEDVVDVLMSDDTRLLRIMVQEELGLTLESHEHPLKQGFGALLGAVSAIIFCLLGYSLLPSVGIIISTIIISIAASIVSAYCARNRFIPAIIWNLGIAAITFGTTYFLLDYLIT